MAKKKKDKEVEEKVDVQEQSIQNEEQNDVDEQVENDTINEEEVIESKEELLEREIIELKDKHLRLQAEFDNYRKRTLNEKAELIKSAGETVLVNLLPVIDDFQRALTSFEKAEDVAAMNEGMNLIATKFESFLKQNGLKEIVALEQDFDTDKHEALTKIPAPTEDLKGKVVDVIEKGYELHDKVIRFAKVVVGE